MCAVDVNEGRIVGDLCQFAGNIGCCEALDVHKGQVRNCYKGINDISVTDPAGAYDLEMKRYNSTEINQDGETWAFPSGQDAPVLKDDTIQITPK